MKRLGDILAWIAVFLCGCVLVAILSYPAWAQEATPKFGRGLVCDTADQAERYVQLFHDGDDGEAIVKSINAEVKDENACAIIPIAFFEEEKVKEVVGAPGATSIVRILVVGFNNGIQWVRVQPFEQYTLYLNKKEEL